ncbi:Transcriptional regulator, MerR family OS=Tsukamurella paurometabola (strain ATCC 8368 / DSM/ CCUG 35730 / CIP 100753 / JCM 10117 / KCTC 9821 / NBRC 16120/ NCIMB 702349 / NCTC 13040) OX=521096 GN=Tpau_3512 PE=4 SV=1 [Tsukamurella paurometabola]|uniref:Transcriptional regulator, MerR family n=1 Tax=Tsukamurella paurometabola (strain ATCC 8368 / DSM 20162 / CCUG 35730 / CIP 100753 / JCM 10117 / KCTC 9821 / NBRC 16120 / NCIMB 702349 / NCTC 13040) TaxID=521096 RepID=D5UX72_TSUPD|nr:MerR family transcriptional regulator [Tsukamurella paurometabola]ADG80091.1 transcriptional regulator, MerR family [Tsukamurella paurometabola DSM 20162]SUP38382.1 DNA-binding transcriptional regulator CueR [Tsukamurella paurometabola]
MTEYRIDDLARVSGTTTRNIRGYQERGLLPQPLRRGRVAIYTEKHLRNLKAINKLLSSGFTLKHIATFLTNPGARIGDALELNEILDEPWSATERPLLRRDELEERLGPLDDAALAGLIAAGIVTETVEDGVYEAADSRIIGNLGRLVDRGMELAVLADVHQRFAQKVTEAAEVFMTAAHEEVDRRRGPGWLPESDDDVAWAVSLFGAMRRAGTENAHAALDRALDAALDSELRAHQNAVDHRASTDEAAG